MLVGAVTVVKQNDVIADMCQDVAAEWKARERTKEYFLKILDSWAIRANIPFAVGGSKEDGRTAVNPMTYLILRAYDKVADKDFIY